MSDRVKVYTGPAIQVTQRDREFWYVPMPSKELAKLLGFEQLKWDGVSSVFVGFNREVDQARVKEIVERFDQPD